MQSIRRFNENFKELFGGRDDEEGDGPGEDSGGNESFDDRFGWIYNAKQVADFENITLDDCYKKDVVSFLNYLVYLKNYNIHIEKLNKNANAANG